MITQIFKNVHEEESRKVEIFSVKIKSTNLSKPPEKKDDECCKKPSEPPPGLSQNQGSIHKEPELLKRGGEESVPPNVVLLGQLDLKEKGVSQKFYLPTTLENVAPTPTTAHT